MAISQTMSNPNDSWSMQMYQTSFSDIPPTSASASADTAAAAAGSSRNNSLSPDQGRVSKPIRKRSRASRRTPTTLLNTDASNFKAMVQQFTGGPSAHAQLSVGGGAAFSFSANTNSTMAAPPPSGFQLMYPNNQLMQPQQEHMFMMNSMHGRGGGFGGGPPSSQAPPGTTPARVNQGYDNFML